MIKSWLSILLPDDEYKKQRMLYFIAEGAVILLIFLGITFGLNHFSSWRPDMGIILGVAIVIFVLYVFFRYTFSGIEYTDVTTTEQYRYELRIFVKKSIIFATTMSIGLFLVYAIQQIKIEWIDILAVSILGAVFMFVINYISLNRSYRINKQLEDD